MAESTEAATASATAAALGHMSLRKTGRPFFALAKGSVVMSTSRLPASAYATTSGGEARKFILISGCTRPSKFRLPESTEQAIRSPALTASEMAGLRGPELPMHVVQP